MLNQALIPEFKHEAASTRKILERVPFDNPDWKPHEKSYTLARMAGHVAEIMQWTAATINSEGLDFAKGEYKPFFPTSKEELLERFDAHYQEALSLLENVSDENLKSNWTLQHGDHVIFTLPKIATLRSFVMNHLIHHRGQLSVYLRLLDVPVPGMYGPSADEK
ncbi:DinB family protein [Flavisolibacter sp. BT320]|nr:DinB family protein [Flavisolibacter longurius]